MRPPHRLVVPSGRFLPRGPPSRSTSSSMRSANPPDSPPDGELRQGRLPVGGQSHRPPLPCRLGSPLLSTACSRSHPHWPSFPRERSPRTAILGCSKGALIHPTLNTPRGIPLSLTIKIAMAPVGFTPYSEGTASRCRSPAAFGENSRCGSAGRKRFTVRANNSAMRICNTYTWEANKL